MIGLILGLCFAAQAADSSWSFDGASQWTNTLRWTAGVPGIAGGSGSADVATFSTALTAARTITVDANRNIGGITFGNTSAFGYTLNTGVIQLSNGGVIQNLAVTGAHTNTISSAIVIQGNGGNAAFTANATSGVSRLTINAVSGVSTLGNTTTLTLDGSSATTNRTVSATVNGVISDGAAGGKLAVVKNGSGIWQLGSANNSFTGGLTINSGTLTAINSGLGNGTVTINGGALAGNSGNSRSWTNTFVIGGNFTIGATGTGATKMDGTMDLGGAIRTITTGGATVAGHTIAAVISNGGLIKIGSENLTISNANTYADGTIVSSGRLIGAADSAFGTGGMTVADGATLILTNGVSNDYISDLAMLIMGTNSTLTLGFTGEDTVGGISLDGGATWLTNGTYSASALDALSTAAINGTGSLTVIPEPATIGMLGLGALITLMVRRMRTR
jgi:autotransporter-associated beta strand protein